MRLGGGDGNGCGAADKAKETDFLARGGEVYNELERKIDFGLGVLGLGNSKVSAMGAGPKGSGCVAKGTDLVSAAEDETLAVVVVVVVDSATDTVAGDESGTVAGDESDDGMYTYASNNNGCLDKSTPEPCSSISM